MQATRNTRSAVGVLATIVSLVLIGGTAVAGEAPFQAAGHATLVRVDRPYEFISVTGGATQLGPFEAMRTIRNSGHTTVATTALVGRNGDSINIYSEVEWDTHFTEATGFFVMTGGTGRFEGATGYGAESIGAFDPAIGARVLTWDGVIDF
jgi:hypothetical protein